MTVGTDRGENSLRFGSRSGGGGGRGRGWVGGPPSVEVS